MPLSVDACFSEPSGLIIRESGFSRTVADRPIFPTANIAKGERNGNKLVWLALPSRILCSPAGQCSESRAQSKRACTICYAEPHPVFAGRPM